MTAGSSSFVVVGESLVDIVVPADGSARENAVGGSCLNVAVGLARLDVPTTLVTRIGDDELGAMVLDHVRDSDVSLSEGSVVPGGITSTATAYLDEHHAATYEFDLDWKLPSQDLDPDTPGVHVGSLGAVLQPGRGSVLDLVRGAVDAGTFVLSAGCIAALQVRSLPQARARSARRELREGLRFVREQPWLWATLVSASTGLLFFLGPLEVLLPFIVRNDIGGGAGGYGAVLACAGVGSILVSLWLSQRGVPRRYLTFMYAAWTVATLPLIGYACGTALWQLGLLSFVYGTCITAGMVVWGTLMSTRVPPELRGRVHSLDWFVSIALTPVSFALTGPVSAWIGVDATMWAAGIVPAVICVVLYAAAGLRRDEERYAGAASGSSAAGASTPAIS